MKTTNIYYIIDTSVKTRGIVANRIKQSEQPIAVLTLGAGDIDRLVKDIKNLKNG